MIQKIIASMISSGLVPVFNHPDPAVGCRVVQACYDGGLRVFEWTNRGEEAERVFKDIKAYVDAHCEGMFLGAGSVFDGETCRRFHAMDAAFIVSPVIEPEMAKTCQRLGIAWIPGCGTATEIHQAHKWGAELIKVFPGDSVGGPSFIKAIRGPMPWVKIMPSGGVSPDYSNLKSWFDAGVVCVGIGSKLFTRERMDDPALLSGQVAGTLEMIRQIRGSKG
jgi:2-dehydro-3-deoxyphosphogluconate aldolase/(4S)-4-hydroxy-2-oxoglutarate aldolase